MSSLLQTLLPQNDLDLFMKSPLHLEPLAKAGAAPGLAGFLTWSVLEKILRRSQDAWLAKDGRLHPLSQKSNCCLQIEEAWRGYREGYTVSVRKAQQCHPFMADLAQNFSQTFAAPTDIHLFYTPKDKIGFDWHYDIEDVFIIQSTGVKEFRLKKNSVSTRPFRLDQMQTDFQQEKTQSEIRCTLVAGDFLYIPAGWWHTAQAHEDSAHFSIGVLRTPTAG